MCPRSYKDKQESWDLNPGLSDSKPFVGKCKFLRGYRVKRSEGP